MSFFNLYNKTEGYSYEKSLKVGDSIFNVGYIDSNDNFDLITLITKLNLNGDLIWEKSYTYESGQIGIGISQMIECTNGDILLVGSMMPDLNKTCLTRIDKNNGNIIWQKKTNQTMRPVDKSIVHIGNENYIIALQEFGSGYNRIIILKIDNNGNIIAHKVIEDQNAIPISLSGIAKGTAKIGIYGQFTTTWAEKGIIIEMDFDLTQITRKIIYENGGGNGRIDYLIYKDNIIYTVTTQIEGTFLTKSTLTSSTLVTDLKQHYVGRVTNIKHNDHAIYLERSNSEFTEISKVEYDFSPQWTKKINHETPFNTYNGGLLQQATNNETIILGGSGTDSSMYSDYPIARLNLDIESCRTIDIERISISEKYSALIISEVDYSLINFNLELIAVSASQIVNVISQKVLLCPAIPDFPCVKDETICDIYAELIKEFNDCILNPELLPEENIDFIKLAECINSFMTLIKRFAKDYPQYNFYDVFENEITFISTFLSNATLSNYIVAWNAMQQMLVYLSSLGNCKCENAIEIDENTLLQSPNFYLQAAGSTGDDSAKGIHLRWALSGILGEKHLPKGNYAEVGNTNNFNKPNDFVKIHKVKYRKIAFELDLSIPPQTVNDSQQFWLYKFDDDTRIFFVYFRNAVKYSQVRTLIDPFVDPLIFIKNYGNELIEIENKRELFFATEVEFSHSDTSSAQFEFLSVRENQIFTPKFLSFRKTYNSAALNTATRAVGENGRMIRFKCNNCYPVKIRFEFYSDFIAYITRKGDWGLLGNYALTLDDTLADKRLDPEPSSNPIHGKWLRFNDAAFVNTENYIDKWNGLVDNSFDRNIKTVVSDYITLSNAINNPTATEFINLNLTIEPASDPDEEPTEPTEDELTEVCNLNLLRIMANDYHIARMLGMGTLDLDAIEAEYVYLASYTTFGDLGNGPEMVKHLYMSLPTTNATQRLPLPIELSALLPGFVGASDDADNDYVNTHDGYSFDGKKRYVSLMIENVLESPQNPSFYSENADIDFSTFTLPVFAGIETRKILPGHEDTHIWEKPELSNDPDYLNIDTSAQSYETVPVILPNQGCPLYMDIQSKSGVYWYETYGINWFSRASGGLVELSITTELKPYNSLLPPANILPFLIRKEFPLMFTSQVEQSRFNSITDEDETLVRIQFDYNTDQDLISYQLPESALDDDFFVNDENSIFPDDFEVFGDEIEIHFRNLIPKTITAKAISVADESLFLSRITTTEYLQVSNGETLLSVLPEGTTIANFIGSLFLMGGQQYLVHNVAIGLSGLEFIVYKQQLGEGLLDVEIPVLDGQTLQSPYLEGDGYFTVVENMHNPSSWGTLTNPHGFKVTIGNQDWTIHRELLKSISDDGQIQKYIEKTRGFWEMATISKVIEEYTFEEETRNEHRGIYMITFNNFLLGNHPQTHANDVSAEWFNGTVRLFTESNVIAGEIYDSRKPFTVFRTENIGSTTENLKLYIYDPSFTLDDDGYPSNTNDIIMGSDTGNPFEVNYYPSYKVYLYHNDSHNLNEEQILPAEGEGTRYSIFGLKTVDLSYTNTDGSFYKSRFSIPAVMAAQEIIEAEVPEGPKGAKYATRPDFYGKSTYTFTTKYVHKPHGISNYRADNQGFLSALYNAATIIEIKNSLKEYGGNEELYFANRWEDFLNFDQLGANPHPDFPERGKYTRFPLNVPEIETYRFPLPDKTTFFEGINSFIAAHNLRFGQSVPVLSDTNYGFILLNEVLIPEVSGQNGAIKLVDFVREAVMNVFMPLTEVPVIYKFIKNSPYNPKNKKQKIRDKNGYLIVPPHDVNNPAEITEFDMAPMMKNISTVGEQKIQYTDFTLDGTSDNVYFYAAKELSSQMKLGAFSAVLGPIKLVNSNPPEAPKIKSMIPILENRVLGISPKINFEITAYPEIQNIKKINLYRTLSRLDANSVQSMDLIKIIDVDVANLTNEAIWTIEDDFSTLPEVPFGDPLYYRLTISRKVEYAEALYEESDEPLVIIEYAPSQPSKIIGTTIVENYVPPAPVVEYYSEPLAPADTDLNFITLHWNETAYKANYRLYKLNSKGNWIEIARVMADRLTDNQYHYFNANALLPGEDWTEKEILNSLSGVVYIQLEMTNINDSSLTILSEDGNKLYHHFKVIAENTSGMFSKEENILTIYNEVTWTDVGGIAVPDRTQGMIVGPTFRVR